MESVESKAGVELKNLMNTNINTTPLETTYITSLFVQIKRVITSHRVVIESYSERKGNEEAT